MIDKSTSLLPRPLRDEPLKVFTVGEEPSSVDELDRLLATLGAKAQQRFLVHPRRISPATYMSEGKLKEIKEQVELSGSDAVVFDFELSPKQMMNLEKILQLPTLDRAGVIIDIFSRHARTREAMVQVELARLRYLLPRLAHFWSHFERQRGGGRLSRGMGEKQLEVDRRLAQNRINTLTKRLEGIRKERQLRRKGRKDILKVALVGYTNAGKSTLLNALTKSSVRAEDKLFATLDSSVRALSPDSHPPIVAIDTVGFIHRIPTFLIASFRSTLEELQDADLLLHVVDASSSLARQEFEVTEKLLKELELDNKPTLTILNKMDRLEGGLNNRMARVIAPGGIRMSALDAEKVAQLRQQVLDFFHQHLNVWEVIIPYGSQQGKLESELHQYGNVETTRYLEKGTYYRVRISQRWAEKLELKKYQ